MSDNFEKIGFDFVPVSKEIAFNYELSYKAKGVYFQLASLPEDWHFTLDGLAKLSTDGRDGVRTALLELEKHGYLKREQTRRPDGLMGESKYTLFSKRQLSEPQSLNPKPVETTQYSIRSNNRLNNKKENVCSIEQTKENPMESLFEVFWSKYPKKQKKKDARIAFLRNVSESNAKKVFDGLEMWLKSEQWSRDHGKYIPLPTSWLNEERWNDELKTTEIKNGTIDDWLSKPYRDPLDISQYEDDDKEDSYVDTDYTVKGA